MTQSIVQAVTKAAIMVIREADNPANNVRLVHTVPRSGSPALTKHAFALKGIEKYQELCNFEIEVKTFS